MKQSIPACNYCHSEDTAFMSGKTWYCFTCNAKFKSREYRTGDPNYYNILAHKLSNKREPARNIQTQNRAEEAAIDHPSPVPPMITHESDLCDSPIGRPEDFTDQLDAEAARAMRDMAAIDERMEMVSRQLAILKSRKINMESYIDALTVARRRRPRVAVDEPPTEEELSAIEPRQPSAIPAVEVQSEGAPSFVVSSITEALVRIVNSSSEPMTVKDIHQAVSAALGKEVKYSTVEVSLREHYRHKRISGTFIWGDNLAKHWSYWKMQESAEVAA